MRKRKSVRASLLEMPEFGLYIIRLIYRSQSAGITISVLIPLASA